MQPRQCSPVRDECSLLVPTHLEGASLVSQITTRCRARAFVCHLVLPCATVVVHARRACHSRFAQPSSCHSVVCSCIAAACLICRCCSLVQTKNSEVTRRHPARLGTEQTLSPLVRVLVSFEHKASSFYTRHQNPYAVAT